MCTCEYAFFSFPVHYVFILCVCAEYKGKLREIALAFAAQSNATLRYQSDGTGVDSNFSVEASCVAVVDGCMEAAAHNFNPAANRESAAHPCSFKSNAAWDSCNLISCERCYVCTGPWSPLPLLCI